MSNSLNKNQAIISNNNFPIQQRSIKNILEISDKEKVKNFFLEENQYFDNILPPYFTFQEILNEIDSNILKTKKKDNQTIENIIKIIQDNKNKKKDNIKTENGDNQKIENIIKIIQDNKNKKKDNQKIENIIKIIQDNKNKKKDKISNHEDVNYKLFHNKDGHYSWRKLQLINPVVYVSLVNEITNNWDKIIQRFKTFKSEHIQCLSIPIFNEVVDCSYNNKAKQISHWWQEIEQKSLELSLDYKYIAHTDISDCYGSIYTHSIEWAMNGKKKTKEILNQTQQNNIGQIIDKHLRYMSHGETNGIPQGSILMDFVAEIVLGYSDCLLSKKINNLITDKSKKISEKISKKISDEISDEISEKISKKISKKISDEISDEISDKINYKILRYRDDYRIFTNNPEDAKKILKILSEVLSGLKMRLNHSKTKEDNDIIESSIKKDKLFYITNYKHEHVLHKEILNIYFFSKKFTNCGTLHKLLQNFKKKIPRKYYDSQCLPQVKSIFAVVVNILCLNPRIYPEAMDILSRLLPYFNNDEKSNILKKTIKKLESLPNTEIILLWLQRVILPYHKQKDLSFLYNNYEYNNYKLMKCIRRDKFGKLVLNADSVKIWDFSWMKDEFRKKIENISIVSKEKLEDLDIEVQYGEYNTFDIHSQ